MHVLRARRVAAVAVLAIAPAILAGRPAQAPPGIDAGRVHDLLVLIASPDAQGAVDAVEELQRMGPAVAPAVVDGLNANDLCRVQWLLSGVLQQLAVDFARVETTWGEVARGRCKAVSGRDVAFQQEAAAALVDRPAGVALVTALLRDREPAARLRAAVALGDLAARLEPTHARPIEATPAMVAAAEASLRPLRDAATSGPREVRCAAAATLDRLARVPVEALRARAASAGGGVRVDCGPTTDARPGARPAAAAPPERWDTVIARLDRQGPPEAAQASMALRHAPAEVEPMLRARLRATDSCQGLALVAGALAARQAADADVDAVFDRVAAGQCRGRSDFATALAHGAAAALAAKPAGIVRLTALLGDRDAAVRQRAARALAGLFTTLGMGEASRPISDPAILEAARAAIGPLVALATTERDRTARCEAVRAIQRAQEARDDGLRREAEAQSGGRTLRCLAPPGP